MSVAWLAVLLAGAGCYLLRLLPVAVLSRRPPPRWLAAVGPLLSPVAFAALAASAVAADLGADPAVVAGRLAALAVAGVVAWRTRSTSGAVVAGMATLWLVRALT